MFAKQKSREMGDLYLDINKETNGDDCRMSVYSAITLFVHKLCKVDQNVTLHAVTVR